MKIQVTQADIERGIKNRCDFCPVAIAISRHLPTGLEITVFSEAMLFEGRFGDGPSTAIDTDQTVVDFIESFDNGKPVAPFSFNLSAEVFMV